MPHDPQNPQAGHEGEQQQTAPRQQVDTLGVDPIEADVSRLRQWDEAFNRFATQAQLPGATAAESTGVGVSEELGTPTEDSTDVNDLLTDVERNDASRPPREHLSNGEWVWRKIMGGGSWLYGATVEGLRAIPGGVGRTVNTWSKWLQKTEGKYFDDVFTMLGYDYKDFESGWLGWLGRHNNSLLANRENPIDNVFEEEDLNAYFGDPQEFNYWTSHLTYGIGRFAPSYAAAGIVTGPLAAGIGGLRGAKATWDLLRTGSFRSALLEAGKRMGIEGLRGAVADNLTFDPYEGNLANMIEDWNLSPDFARGMVDLFSVDGDDSEIVARLKMTGEGMMLGWAIDGIRELRYAGRAQERLLEARMRNAPESVQEEIAEEVVGHLENAARIEREGKTKDLQAGKAVVETVVEGERYDVVLPSSNNIPPPKPPSQLEAVKELYPMGPDQITDQAIGSAGTSLNQIPAGHKALISEGILQPGSRNADIGGGRYDKATKALEEQGVENVVYDPFNRDVRHNSDAVDRIANGQSDTATIMNVLNVIAEPEARARVIKQALNAVKEGGEVWIGVYEGNRSGVGAETTKGFQNNRKLADYLEEIREVMPTAEIETVGGQRMIRGFRLHSGLDAGSFIRSFGGDALAEGSKVSIDGVTFQMTPNGPKTVTLDLIQVDERPFPTPEGQAADAARRQAAKEAGEMQPGEVALRKFLDAADEEGITIDLMASNLRDQSDEAQQALRRWYQRNGFTEGVGPHPELMRRPPGNRRLSFRSLEEATEFAGRINVRVEGQRGMKGALSPEDMVRINALAAELRAAPFDQWNQILKKGVINVNYTQGASQASAMISAIAEVVPASKQPEGLQRVQHLTQMFENLSDEEALERLAVFSKGSENLEQNLVATAIYFDSVSKRVSQLAELVDMHPGDATMMAELGKATEHAFAVAEHLMAQSSGMGRGLGAHARMSELTDGVVQSPRQRASLDEMNQKRLQDLGLLPDGNTIDEIRDMKIFSNLTPDEIQGLARRMAYRGGNESEHIFKIVRDAYQEAMVLRDPRVQHKEGFDGFAEKLAEWRTNALVSGSNTTVTNLLSGVMKLGWHPLTQLYAGIRTGNPVLQDEGIDLLVGNLEAVWEGLRAFGKAIHARDYIGATGNVGRAFMTNSPVRDPGGVIQQAMLTQKIPGLWGAFANFARRPLLAGDELIKSIAGRSYARAQARKAFKQKRGGELLSQDPAVRAKAQKALDKFVDDQLKAHVSQGTSEMIGGRFLDKDAQNYARMITFTEALGANTLGGRFGEIIARTPVFRVLFPFHRISVQLFRQAWALTPVVGRYAPQMRRQLESSDPAVRATAEAQMQFGAALWAAGGGLTVTGALVGRGPSDPEMNKQWRQAGNRPYSLTAFGKQWDLRKAWPLSAPLMMSADAVSLSGELPDVRVNQAALHFMASMGHAASSQTFMRTMTEFLDAISGDDPSAMHRYFTTTARTFIPFGMTMSQADPDEVMREAHSWMEEILKPLPLNAAGLEPQRNAFGEKVMRPPGTFNRAINPFTPSPATDPNDLLVRMADLGYKWPTLSPREGNLDFQDRDKWSDTTRQSPYDRIMEAMGTGVGPFEPIRKVMEDLAAQVDFELPPGATGSEWSAQAEALRRAYAKQLSGVKNYILLNEYPKLAEAVVTEAATKAGQGIDDETVEQLRRMASGLFR